METVDLLLIFGTISLFISIFIAVLGSDFEFEVDLPAIDDGAISLTAILLGLTFFFFTSALTFDITKIESIAYVIGILDFFGGYYLGIKSLLLLKRGKKNILKSC